jgi:hypothetical protein
MQREVDTPGRSAGPPSLPLHCLAASFLSNQPVGVADWPSSRPTAKVSRIVFAFCSLLHFTMTSLQLPAGVNRRYASLAGIVLAATWIWVAFDRPYRFPTHIPWNIYSNGPQSSPGATAADVFDFAPIDSESIKSICSDALWNSTVAFTCDNSVGGVGNIRNSILNCVRYAISAGGSLVVPKVIVRNSDDIAKIRTGERTKMDYMFDPRHFIESLRLSCPSLQLYNTVDDITNPQNPNSPIPLLPESLVKEHIPAAGLTNPEAWRGLFYDWLEQYNGNSTGASGPIIVELARSYLQYPIYTDGEGFALEFGSILKFRSDIRVLATTTLYRLSEAYSLSLDLSQPILRQAYFGAHLRTEKDAKEGWPAPDWIYSRYDTQSKYYLEQASGSNKSVIYVASGDLDEVTKFANDSIATGMTVTTKFDLLEGEDRAQLERLAWDQQAMIDFLVLLKASDFAGVGHSSFAWNVALKRHTVAEKKNHLDGPQMLSDELSQIYGIPRGYPEYAACLWP